MLVVGGRSKHLKVFHPEYQDTYSVTNTSSNTSTISSRSINVSKGGDKNLVWEEVHQQLLHDVDNTASEVSDICWSPHAHFLAVCGKKWEHFLVVCFKSLSDTKEYRIKIPNGRYQNCCAFEKTGSTLATAGISGIVYIWTFDTGSLEWTKSASISNPTLNTVNYIAWNPTAAFLCTGDTKGHVVVHIRDKDHKLYNFVEKVDMFEEQQSTDVEVTALECNPYFPHQPSQVAVGLSNGVLRLWDIGTRKMSATITSHSSTITDIAYSTMNGMLVATSSLDGTIHLIALQTQRVIKRYDCTKPVYSLEFIKGKYPYFVYITENEIGTYRLREPWPTRKTMQIDSAQFVRFKSSRDPVEESEQAYMARTSVEVETQKTCKDIAKNKAELKPHKPSPAAKGLTRQDISNSFGAAVPSSSTDHQLKTTEQQLLATPSSSSESRAQNMLQKTANSRNISDIQEEDVSFNISDIADYTDRGDEDKKSWGKHEISDFMPHYKRSHTGNLKEKKSVFEEEESVSPNKLRRVEEEEKENKCPSYCNDTPKEVVQKKHRFSASTPAVSNSNIPYNFGTPTSSTNLFQSPTVFLKNKTNVSSMSDVSSPGIISALRSPVHSVNELSNKLKNMGNTQTSSFLQVPCVSAGKSVISENTTGNNISQNVLTPNSEKICNSPNPESSGMVMSTEQMSIIQTIISQGFTNLENKLCSETRWLKNEIVKNTLATEWNLEDKLAGVNERLSRLEQMCAEMQHDIRTIKNNI